VCPGQVSLLSYLLYGEGCGYSLLRAGMTSVGVGCVIQSIIVSVCSTCLSAQLFVGSLACCRKNAFREKGVHVYTVAVSLFLDCIWNFLVGGGGSDNWLAAPQEARAPAPRSGGWGALPHTAVVWHQGSHSPHCCLGCLT